MKEITVQELADMQDNAEDFVLIDVREDEEYEQANIGGEHIPMGTVPQNINSFPKEGKVVVMCRSGNRSGRVIQFLEQNHGYDNLLNLQGGILAWKEQIDETLDVE